MWIQRILKELKDKVIRPVASILSDPLFLLVAAMMILCAVVLFVTDSYVEDIDPIRRAFPIKVVRV